MNNEHTPLIMGGKFGITADNELAFVKTNADGSLSYFVFDKIPTEPDSFYYLNITKTPGKYESDFFNGKNLQELIDKFNDSESAPTLKLQRDELLQALRELVEVAQVAMDFMKHFPEYDDHRKLKVRITNALSIINKYK
jgi:hypothetical protein